MRRRQVRTRETAPNPPDDTATPSPPKAELIALYEPDDHREIVDDYIRSRSTGSFRTLEPPTREQYHLILTFKSQIMKHYKASPRGWLRRERALLEVDRHARDHRYHAIMPAKPKPNFEAKSLRVQRGDRVMKPQSSSTKSSAPHAIRDGTGVTYEPSHLVIAHHREDKDFNSLPDYCPPIDTLSSRPNSLEIGWKHEPGRATCISECHQEQNAKLGCRFPALQYESATLDYHL